MVGKEKEPREVEQNGGEEKDGVSPGEVLAAALNGDESEEGNPQIDEQYTVVESPQRSD